MATKATLPVWLIPEELPQASGVRIADIRGAMESGMLTGWARLDDNGVLWFHRDVVTFLTWADRLMRRVPTGEIEPVAAAERIWHRAWQQRGRQRRQRLATAAKSVPSSSTK
jgi:hypothetical protein